MWKRFLAGFAVLTMAIAIYSALPSSTWADLVLIITDGIHTITGVQEITVTGGTVGGSGRNATVTITGPSASDGMHTVPGVTSFTFGPGLVVSGSGGSAVVSLSASPSTIIATGIIPSSFPAQSGNAGLTVGTLSTTVSSGTFGGSYALATIGGCAGADNSSFSIAGNTVKIGGGDLTAARTYFICISSTDPSFSNSPFYQSITLTGSSPAPSISSISVTPATFTAQTGNANATIGALSTAVSSGSFAGAYSLTSTGAGCADSGSFAISGSSLTVGASDVTTARVYNICVVATGAGFSNSPFTQAMTVTGTAPTVMTITSVVLTPTTFTAQAGNANSTVGSLGAMVSSGSFSPGGTFALATSGGCTGPDNTKFVIAGSTLSIGSTDLGVGTYTVCVRATNATFSNSPFFQAIAISGVSAGTLVLTTATYKNYSGVTLPAGSPVSMGQGFRYGDIMPGHYPLIRDAATHSPLAGQQWDEIATWRENGGNNSWRHAVWSIWLPSAVPAGGTFQIEFVVATGTYSQTSKQAISALCSGSGAHDIKIHLGTVRNQDYSIRDSGDATFRVCDNISNAGRDAPRHLRAGNVMDEYVVSGLPVYTSTNKDPILYVQCIMDIFTSASDGVSPGDTRWVCHIHNDWESVSAGSTGRGPGPAGFANDPQAPSAIIDIFDGSTNILNWHNFDTVVDSSTNPVQSENSAPCLQGFSSWCLHVGPQSAGPNSWFTGQTSWVTCSNVCIGGLTNNSIVYAGSSSQGRTGGGNNEWVMINLVPAGAYNPPHGFYGDSYPLTGAQGVGTTTFTNITNFYHWETFQTLDYTGLDNWAPKGSSTRQVRKVYPAFTTAERRYWEETGNIVPITLNQPSNVAVAFSQGLGTNYEPNGRLNVIGSTSVGTRPDIGVVNGFAAQAWITQSESDWDLARLFSFGAPVHGLSTLIDESTGLIPVVNNGPPGGPGGNGLGGCYAGLGCPQNQLYWGFGVSGGIADCSGIAPPGLPSDLSGWVCGGTMNFGTYLSHLPSFTGITYPIFGDRHFLDMIYWSGNEAFMQQRPGPGPINGQGYYRDNFAFEGATQYHYWGLLIDCCQARGSAWMMRNITNGGGYGGDANPERGYYADFLTENNKYYPKWQAAVDGPGSTNYTNSLEPPNRPGSPGAEQIEIFIWGYTEATLYTMVALQHAPFGSQLSRISQRAAQGVLGGQLPGAPVPYYTVSYDLLFALHDGSCNIAGSDHADYAIGPCWNGTDASDYIQFDVTAHIDAGGLITGDRYNWSGGGFAKSMYVAASNGGPKIDQLPTTSFKPTIGPYSNGGSSFYIQCDAQDHINFPAQCPVAGGPFTGYTSNGSNILPITLGFGDIGFRLTLNPGPSTQFVNYNYVSSMGNVLTALTILGYDVAAALNNYNIQSPNFTGYRPEEPAHFWDSTIVVPGLPPACNLLPGPCP